VSQETIEIARRMEAAMNSTELPHDLLTPDFVMVNAATAVTDSTYEGAQGVARWRTDLFEAFDDAARFEIEEVLADGTDFVVTMNRIEGTGARSGAPLLFRWPAVLWCKDGKLTRVVGYRRRREAFEAVGLAR
jgi:ketosteroid isomerase-like protein